MYLMWCRPDSHGSGSRYVLELWRCTCQRPQYLSLRRNSPDPRHGPYLTPGHDSAALYPKEQIRFSEGYSGGGGLLGSHHFGSENNWEERKQPRQTKMLEGKEVFWTGVHRSRIFDPNWCSFTCNDELPQLLLDGKYKKSWTWLAVAWAERPKNKDRLFIGAFPRPWPKLLEPLELM